MLRRWIKRTLLGDESWRAEEPFRNVEIFFILGMGRSGTNFLASILNRCPNSLVYHEPLAADFEAFVAAHKSLDSALEYFSGFRLRQMRRLIEGREIKHYGEVNSALRYHAGAIKSVLPDARLLHLVRDGRDVVRSVMERQHYQPGASGHHDLRPLPADPYSARWDRLGRFEKVCWLWADANRRLADDVREMVQFESLVGDYGYFKQKLLDYLGLDMSEAQWTGVVRAPTNATREFTFPPWREWEQSQKTAFEAICGEQMLRCGYEL